MAKPSVDSGLTAQRLRELLHYDSATGLWRWVKSTSNCVKVGCLAGAKDGNGYWQISVDGRRYPAARLAFLYMIGKWPSSHVDHIDCDPDNNRWGNLRDATRAQNAANRRRRKNNTSGYKGVSWHKRDRKWIARICVSDQEITLGYFDDPVEAAGAYAVAAEKHFGAFARTR